MNRFNQLLDTARAQIASDPRNVAVRFKLVEALLLCGYNSEARLWLAEIEAAAGHDPAMLARAAAIYSRAHAHDEALRCCEAALRLAPHDCELLSNLAAAEIACGKLADAEAHLTRVLELNPTNGPSWYNRAVVRRWSSEHNHIKELRVVLATTGLRPIDEVPMRYALAKALEDIGEFGESFTHLDRGASLRRASLSYRVDGDEEAMAAIALAFSPSLMARASRHPLPSEDTVLPLFVMGMPRSGTTLVDRILSSHSQVTSLGEIADFELALVRAVGEGVNKMDAIRRATQLDFPVLGGDYRRSISTYPFRSRYCLDKTPRNYLYAGLISLALPQARIVHVQRDPMDTCYALYKTLFGAGVPYSYSLEDIARYYVAYYRLMEHWRRTIPDRIVDIAYERLVSAQESASRELLDQCGLSWESRCLTFHTNPTPAATASAAQVREPIHSRSVGLWKRYERQLRVVANRLQAAGIL